MRFSTFWLGERARVRDESDNTIVNDYNWNFIRVSNVANDTLFALPYKKGRAMPTLPLSFLQPLFIA
jgi:hypothetical protein